MTTYVFGCFDYQEEQLWSLSQSVLQADSSNRYLHKESSHHLRQKCAVIKTLVLKFSLKSCPISFIFGPRMFETERSNKKWFSTHIQCVMRLSFYKKFSLSMVCDRSKIQ